MSEDTSRLADYPRINPAFVPVVVDENTVRFTTGAWSGPVFELTDEEREGKLARLVAMLDGTTHVSDVLDSFDESDRPTVRAVLERLHDQSILRDPGTSVDDERAGVGWYLSNDVSERPLERLENSEVVTVGAGEVGRIVTRNLLGAGIRTVRYFDVPDGAEWVSETERTSLVKKRHLRRTVGKADFVVSAMDTAYPRITTEINELVHETDTPWTVGQVNGLDGQVGPTVYPGETACYECFRNRAAAATIDRGSYDRFEKSPDAGPLLGSFAHVVGGMTAMDVIRQVAGERGITVGAVIDFDFADFAVEADELLRLPRCETCGKSSDRLDAPRHVSLERLVDRSIRGVRDED